MRAGIEVVGAKAGFLPEQLQMILNSLQEYLIDVNILGVRL